MVWNKVAELRGPQGPVGPAGPEGPGGGAGVKYYGILRWGATGQVSVPKGQHTMLTASSNAQLKVLASVGNVAQVHGLYAVLWTPVAGLWQLSASQAWTAEGGAKGVGLGKTYRRATENRVLWGDFNNSSVGQVSITTWLPKGAYLYPWVWAGVGSPNLTASYEGLDSEFSAVLVCPT